MMKLAAALALVLVGCVDTTPTLTRVKTTDAQPNTVVLVEQDDERLLPVTDEHDYCNHLPQDGSVCQYACDPEKLAELIPKNVCALIVCDLDDGTRINVGGCF